MEEERKAGLEAAAEASAEASAEVEAQDELETTGELEEEVTELEMDTGTNTVAKGAQSQTDVGETTETVTIELTKQYKVVVLVQAAFREGDMTYESTQQEVSVMPKW